MSARDPDGDAARDRFAKLLAAAEARSAKIPIWWRDDDATTATPELEQLLSMARSHRVPLGLAVIPKEATADLAQRLADEAQAAVLQHGWRHRNHSPPEEKKTELGPHRALDAIGAELGRGHARLTALFPERFLPVLVPPWNRMAESVHEVRRTIGLAGFSAFGPAPIGEAHWVNTHVDIIDWRTRGPLSRSAAYALLAEELERRLGGDPEPLGILTHHLIHQPASWAFLDELFETIARHPVVAWPPVAELFGLDMPSSQARSLS